MGTAQEFLSWESASRDTIDVKKIYIDVVDDLVAGVLLSQIIYWFLPGENGKSKLSQQYKDKLCLTKNRNDWWDECRITEKQYDRAIKILIQLELVVVKTSKWNGNPAHFIWLDTEKLWERVKTILTKGEYQDYPKVNNDIDQRGITYNNTETTKTETTTENINTFAPSYEKTHSSQPPKLSFSFEKGIFENIPELLKQKWHTAFPAVDIQFEFEKMSIWLLTHPKNKKSDYPRFINNWLVRAQDRAGSLPDTESPKKKIYTQKEIEDMRRWRDKGFPKTYWQGLEAIENGKQ